MFNFVRNHHLPTWPHHFAFPPTINESSNCCISLPALDIVKFFVCFSSYIVAFTVTWVCISLMVNEVEHIFKCLFTIHISYMKENLFKSSAHFVNGLFVLLLGYKSSSWSRCKTFIQDVFCKYILPVCGLSFHFLNSVF